MLLRTQASLRELRGRKVCDRYKEINTESRHEPDSVFQYYKELVKLRKELPVIQKGAVTPLLREDKEILAYKT